MSLGDLMRYLQRRRRRKSDTPNLDLSVRFTNGHWDSLRVAPSGLVTLEGWWTGTNLSGLPLPKAEWNGRGLPLLHIHRVHRPDVAQTLGSANLFMGLAVTWLDKSFAPAAASRNTLRIFHEGKMLLKRSFQMLVSEPHYSALLHTDRMFQRNDIYGVGPPPPINSPEVQALAGTLRGKVLDFGCGSGFLVKMLRASGIEAYGIELKREAIETNLHPEAREFVTLYDGHLPAPFTDASFDSIISAEVIEHLPDPEAAIAEMARLCRSTCIFTVPDMSAIPLCFYHSVVPWHLLEASHQNFFTQSSLQALLTPHFQHLTFFRLHPEQTNGTKWYGSIAVIAQKT